MLQVPDAYTRATDQTAMRSRLSPVVDDRQSRTRRQNAENIL
jgi:hypothetical protein